MSDTLHGHEVLEWLLGLERPLPLDALAGAIEERFGAETRFHTCSAEGLTARELVALFVRKGKLVPAGEGLAPDRARICDH